jgi:hypothetical protein
MPRPPASRSRSPIPSDQYTLGGCARATSLSQPRNVFLEGLRSRRAQPCASECRNAAGYLLPDEALLPPPSGGKGRSAASGCRPGGQHTDSVVLRYTFGGPPMYLARRPASATCAAAGRHRHSRPAEVHARSISGQPPGGDISWGAEVLAESTYSDRAVFPGAWTN